MLSLIKFPRKQIFHRLLLGKSKSSIVSVNFYGHHYISVFLFLGLLCFSNGQRYSSSSSSSSSPSQSAFSSFQLPPSIAANLWNQLSSVTSGGGGNRRHDEQLEQGPLFLGGSFDFDLNELAHLIQPMYDLIKNSEIIKVDQGNKNHGNSMNTNSNDQMITSASSNRPGLTFSPSFGLGSTQIKPLITLAVPEIEFLNGNKNNRHNNNNDAVQTPSNNNNYYSDNNGNLNHHQHLNSHRFSSNQQQQLINRYAGRPIQNMDPFLASASGDLGPLTSSNFNNIGINRDSFSSSSTPNSNNGRRKKKRKQSNKNKTRTKPLIQIVDDDQDEADQSNNEEEDSLVPMSSNNNANGGDESDDDLKETTDESQALDQILEMGLPTFLMEEIFGLNKRILKPGKILAHLTFGALARRVLKRFFKSFLARSRSGDSRSGLLRRAADRGCRSVKGLNLRESVILPLGVALTLHPLLLPFMPAMLFTLGSLKAIESATCYVSNAYR